MSMVAYDQFLPEVLPYVRDCPEFVAVNAIRNACIEFCEESTFLRQDNPEITIVPGQADYDLETLIGTSVVMILSAQIGQIYLRPKALEELDSMYRGGWRERQGTVLYVTQEHYNQVKLVMVPDREYDDPLKLILAVRPERTSTKISKVIYERYAEVIGFGARARLHDTPGQPYSDAESALRMRKWFESGYGKAKIAANRGRGRAVLVVRPQRI